MKKVLFFLFCICSYSYASNVPLKGSDKPELIKNTSDGICYLYDKFEVITKHVSSGESILVKRSDKDDCAWKESSGWVINGGLASFFEGVYKDKIIVDRGTSASPRNILIYDAITKKQVFMDEYFGDIQISKNKLIYWKASTVVATKNNCNVFEKSVKLGLSVKLMDKVIVDLSNDKFERKILIVHRCELMQ